MSKQTEPQDGDVLVTRHTGHGGYVILEALTGQLLAGPFARGEYAIGVAHSVVWKRPGSRILGQGRDGRIEVLCTIPHAEVEFLSEMCATEPEPQAES